MLFRSEEGRTLRRAGRLEPARERLRAAADAFSALYDDHRAAEAHDALGATLYNLGWLAESMAEYTIAQRGWRLLAEPEAQIATMNNMAVVQHMLGEMDTARDAFKAVIERARALSQRRYEAYGTEGLAAVDRDLGLLESAIPLYTIAIHEAQEVDDPALIMAATYGLAMCYRDRGDHGARNEPHNHPVRVGTATQQHTSKQRPEDRPDATGRHGGTRTRPTTCKGILLGGNPVERVVGAQQQEPRDPK